MRLPGRCVVCGDHVIMQHPRAGWLDMNRRKHVCGRICNAWMPQALERCARYRGHGTEHRSAYAMANARARRDAA